MAASSLTSEPVDAPNFGRKSARPDPADGASRSRGVGVSKRAGSKHFGRRMVRAGTLASVHGLVLNAPPVSSAARTAPFELLGATTPLLGILYNRSQGGTQ